MNEENIKTFVKQARKALNLTQEEFSLKLDIGRVAIADIERGVRHLRTEEYIAIKKLLQEKEAECNYVRLGLEDYLK